MKKDENLVQARMLESVRASADLM